MFKHVGERAMELDIHNMVERPITRAGLREDESRALAILEDPIEFSQNITRVLEGGELQGMLINAMPVTPEEQLRELQEMLREAIKRRDWNAATKLFDELDDETNAATSAAREYGIAIGAVMEQFRTGLLDTVRLRNAGMTRHDRRVAKEITELRSALGLQEPRKQERHEGDHAAD